jgi:hypothetical protein
LVPSKRAVYLFFDIESNGPVPGLYSMIQVGMVLKDASTFETVAEKQWSLKPLEGAQEHPDTMRFWREQAPDTYAVIMAQAVDPALAVADLHVTLQQWKRTMNIVTAIAWPINFDWMFVCWYLHRFVGTCELGFSARCAASYAWATTKVDTPRSDMTPWLQKWMDPQFAHTHDALDDARSLAARFANMYRENIASKSMNVV